MNDLISRSALIKVLKLKIVTKDPHIISIANAVVNLVREFPSVDAVPVVHAKWIAQNEYLTRFMCSNCKSENHEGFETYCPKCGAKMDLR